MKFCNTCQTSKPDDQFSKKGKGLQSRCKACHTNYLKEHYNNNKIYYKDKASISRQGKRQWMRDFKATLACSACGENDPCCLDFHHTNGEEKEFLVSGMAGHGVSKDKILKEIAKCVVLCANCHRKLHSGTLARPAGFEPAA